MDVAGANAQSLIADLRVFEKARHSSSELAELFANPGVPLETKLSVATEIGKRIKLNELGQKLIEVLVRNQRINQLGAVLDAWRDLLNKQLGVAVAQVKSAQPLAADEQDKLRKALEAKLGKKVELELSIDASLLGGFVASVGSSVYDASVIGRVHRLETTNQ